MIFRRRWEPLDLGRTRSVGSATTTADERWIVLWMLGRRPELVCLDGSLTEVESVRDASHRRSISADGTRLLLDDVTELRVLSLPELDELSTSQDARELGALHGFLADPHGRGWIAVPSNFKSPPLGLVSTDLSVVRRVGHVEYGHVRGAALDASVGLLVTVTQPARIECIDTRTLTSLWTKELRCGGLTGRVAAIGGVAWIGTDDGTGDAIAVDLRSRRTLERVTAPLAGRVSVWRSTAAPHLAILTVRRNGLGDVSMHLAVRSVGPAGSEELRSTSWSAYTPPHDLTVLGSQGRVVVWGAPGASAVWRYGD